MNNLVSIITPFFNRENLVIETINSIKSQTYANWELIIIDDGSDDNSFNIIQKFVNLEKRIKIFKRNRLPKGPSTCRNIGLENSSGDYVIFLDSDDLMHEKCLEQRLNIINQNESNDFVVFNSKLFSNRNNLDDLNILWNIENQDEDLKRFLRFDGVWAINGPIYKRNFIIEHRFDEEIPFYEDAIIAIHILLKTKNYLKCFDLPPDIFIRWHFDDSLSRTVKDVDVYFLKTLDVVIKNFLFLKKNKKKWTFQYQKQFIFLLYKLSKEAFNCNNKFKLCFASLKHLLRIFPWGLPFYFFFSIGQLLLFALSKNKSKIAQKIRVSIRQLMDFSVYKILKIKETTLFKINLINEK